MAFLTLFRFSVVSRGYLIIYTFIVPLILMIFRNSEVISAIFGRSVTSETYISFNLKKDSLFRELRLVSLRKNLESFENPDQNDFSFYKRTIENFNKENSINIVIFNLENINNIPKEFEAYLLNLNKKILIIADQDFKFNNFVIMREEEINDKKIREKITDCSIDYSDEIINKSEIKLDETTVTLQSIQPKKPITTRAIRALETKGIVTHLNFLKIKINNFTKCKFL